MSEKSPTGAGETIFGLDPRALLARAARERAMSTGWEAPGAAEVQALFPRLENVEFIGRGGMGAAYRARQPGLDRLVAIKLLSAEAAADEAFAERFATEARALAQLQHPHIVAIHDFGQTSAGHLFLLMEWVEGGDLAALLRSGRLAPERAVAIARELCAALSFAHAGGIVHRDIKPANLLLTREGAVKVADFGLARLRAAEAANAGGTTAAGTVLGTPDYMAPEQRAGGPVDARADLFSAGVVLYEMLTGQLPRGSWAPPSTVTRCAPRLDAIVRRALQAEPEKRFQSAGEFAAELSRMGVAPHGRWRLLVAAACAVAVLLAGALLWWKDARETRLAIPVTSPAATPARDAPRELTPLAGLVLADHIVQGDWHWHEGLADDTLALPLTQDRALKAIRLPVQPGARAYDIAFQLWLENEGSNAALIFPAGGASVSLVLDLYGTSGLDLVRGAQWKANESTVQRALPLTRFFPVEVSVRPDGERVAIAVRVDGEPFLRWEGAQRELALNGVIIATPLRGDRSLALASSGGAHSGGIRVREVKVRAVEEAGSNK